MDVATKELEVGGIAARGLTRRFGEHLALSPPDLDAPPGRITGLLGPNGSGKSTLLRCLTGLVRADAGTATVGGAALVGDGTAVRRRCTYSPGEVAVYGELSGAAHLDWLTRGRDDAAPARAKAIAEDLGLPLGRRVATYSHGMKRQLYLAAALAPDLPVRVLDEITEGLDPHLRGRVLDLLEDDARAGRAILLSSHHLGEVDRVCDRLVFLSGGVKIAEETADDLADRARAALAMGFASADDAQRFVATIDESSGVEVLRADGGDVAMRARGATAAEVLPRLLAATGAPTPTTIRAGELSLQDLYRDLYGVDAC